MAVRSSASTALLSANEKAVASFVDGFRPIARVKVKTGLSADQFRHALRGLVRRQMLVLVAMIEESQPELVGLREATSDSTEGEPATGHTMPRADHDIIPPHVMAEIEAMIAEEERLANVADCDEETEVVVVNPLPRKRDDER